LTRIISAGEAGAERGALDAAIELGIAHGGWCVKGRRAQDGVIDARYALDESFSPTPAVALQRNVVDGDGTVVFVDTDPGRASLPTRAVNFCIQRRKPALVVNLRVSRDPQGFLAWVARNGVKTLHVTGEREDAAPGLAELVRAFLVASLRR
jgi:hypothetical protein